MAQHPGDRTDRRDRQSWPHESRWRER
jgi:hypothetical protein